MRGRRNRQSPEARKAQEEAHSKKIAVTGNRGSYKDADGHSMSNNETNKLGSRKVYFDVLTGEIDASFSFDQIGLVKKSIKELLV